MGSYFQITLNQAKQITSEVKSVTDKWYCYAGKLGISRQEQQLLETTLK